MTRRMNCCGRNRGVLPTGTSSCCPIFLQPRMTFKMISLAQLPHYKLEKMQEVKCFVKGTPPSLDNPFSGHFLDIIHRHPQRWDLPPHRVQQPLLTLCILWHHLKKMFPHEFTIPVINSQA